MADTAGARVEGPYTYDAYGNCFVGATTTSCTTLAATAEPFGNRFAKNVDGFGFQLREVRSSPGHRQGSQDKPPMYL